jgi:hypothetical protein
MWSNGQFKEQKVPMYKRPEDVRYWKPGAKEAMPNFSMKLLPKIKNIKSKGYNSLLFVLILTSFKMSTVIIITREHQKTVII